MNTENQNSISKNPSSQGGVMPRSLTAENGAKALLMGEFKEVLTLLDDDGNEVNYEVPVSWSTIKEIYDRVVAHYGA